MTPYRLPSFRPLGNLAFTVILGTVLGVTLSRAETGPEKADFAALTRAGWEHFYSLEYDLALRDFERALEARPDDAAAVNHVLDGVLYRELYKYNALDTRLYAKQGFLNSKQVPVDSSVKQRIKGLTDRAMSLSDNRLKSDPNDVQALYNRGVTEGLRSTYLVIVEHAWFAALRSALAARHDHEQVLKFRPDWKDAETIVGAHNYVVGSLTTPVKAMAGIAGIHGNKDKGLRMLAEAGKAGGETSADARVALALFLRREGRFQEGLDVVRTLTHDHPHNFLFALEEGNLLKETGKNVEAEKFFQELLSVCKQGKYPNPHVEMAYFSLGEALRAQGRLQEALLAYDAAAKASSNTPDYGQRALLAGGEVSDILAKRQEALAQYRAAIALDGSSEEAETARKYLEKPYKGN
jgi:tetratricopeptide (TPR) repeat protein